MRSSFLRRRASSMESTPTLSHITSMDINLSVRLICANGVLPPAQARYRWVAQTAAPLLALLIYFLTYITCEQNNPIFGNGRATHRVLPVRDVAYFLFAQSPILNTLHRQRAVAEDLIQIRLWCILHHCSSLELDNALLPRAYLLCYVRSDAWLLMSFAR